MNCRSCESGNLTEVLTLGDQYLADFRTDSQKPERYPLNLIRCTNCSLVQLDRNTPPSALYNERYGYRSGINSTIRADLAEIANRGLCEAKTIVGDIVMDIGANDGTLLSNIPKHYRRIAVEPIAKFAAMAKEHADVVVNDYFSAEVVKEALGGRKVRLLTSVSMFYDLPDPNKFTHDASSILARDGVWVIQQNYLASMLQQNAFDNIVHEHIEYYTLGSLEPLLDRHGLEVYHVETNNINGGSFRTFIQHQNQGRENRRPDQTVFDMRKAELEAKLDTTEPYDSFSKRVGLLTTQLHGFIEGETAEGKLVYAYGASTRGNTLLQAATLDNQLVSRAVERNPEKYGKRIASLDIPIISEAEMRQSPPDYLLILPWFFLSEFLVREKEYLGSGRYFIVPLPQFKIM